jgi:hypothetical protein
MSSSASANSLGSSAVAACCSQLLVGRVAGPLLLLCSASRVVCFVQRVSGFDDSHLVSLFTEKGGSAAFGWYVAKDMRAGVVADMQERLS